MAENTKPAAAAEKPRGTQVDSRRVGPAGTVTTKFDGTTEQLGVERSTTARSAAAVAKEQAPYIVARGNKRSPMAVYQKLLEYAGVPAFAECADYQLSFGAEAVQGPSIDFARAIAAEWGNCDEARSEPYEDDQGVLIEVAFVDYETNRHISDERFIERSVERKYDGPGCIGQRKNSRGEISYLFKAREDQMFAKVQNYKSRLLRNCILAGVPKWVWEEAFNKAIATKTKKITEDPNGELKKIVAALSELKVSVGDVEQLFGMKLDKFATPDIVKLRAVYAAIRGGTVTMQQLLREAGADPEDDGTKKSTLDDLVTKSAAAATAQTKPPVVVDAGSTVKESPAETTQTKVPQKPDEKPSTAKNPLARLQQLRYATATADLTKKFTNDFCSEVGVAPGTWAALKPDQHQEIISRIECELTTRNT